MDALQDSLLFLISIFSFVYLVECVSKNKERKEIPALGRMKSLSYSPFSHASSIDDVQGVDVQLVKQELSILKRFTSSVRTYSMEGAQALIPGIAVDLGFEVSLGIWIGPDEERNLLEINSAIAMVKKDRRISRVIVGSESLFRHDVRVWKLKEYLDCVRQAVDVPVTTAELWHIWLDNPTLVDHTDEITVHILPFWEGVSAEEGADYVFDVYARLERFFPGKKIYIGEIGWPSAGQSFTSVPSDKYQQSEHIRVVIDELNRRGVDYNVVEAFDQQWKVIEGTVGRHWGVLSRNGTPKFIIGGRTLVPKESLSVLSFHFFRSFSGKTLIALMSAFFLVAFVEHIWQAFIFTSISEAFLITLGCSIWLLATAIIGLHETLERFLMPRKEKIAHDQPDFDPTSLKVAFHLACRNEPAQMVINTLIRLSEQDHGSYEVYVVDNNTSDEETWRPVRDCCTALGEKFHFWHVDDLEGFKGGALNFLLEHTCSDADIIAVVDSDYEVEADWLRLLFFFSDPALAVIQSPQDYRDKISRFKRICYFEYKSFFNTGMIIRDHFNAIILHGTMTLIRANVLRRLRWAGWCVCEDAELGLRILKEKQKMMYVPVSYGKGLMPDGFFDYKRQRARWVTGAVQILCKHSDSIFSFRSELSWAQKYQFIVGWAHWLVQATSLLLTAGITMGSLFVLLGGDNQSSFPIAVSMALVIAFFLNLLAQISLYVKYSPDGTSGAWLSIIASEALTYTVARSVFFALVPGLKEFVVTPKGKDPLQSRVFPMDCVAELAIFLSLSGLVVFILYFKSCTFDHALWALMLAVRSIPYAMATILSVCSRLQSRVF